MARPPAGQLGTVFQLQGTKFQAGQKVAVEIDLPNGQVYKGQTHTATPDGTVNASYRTSTGDPTGTYEVKIITDRGHNDIGHFEVTAPGPGTTATTKGPNPKRP